MSQLTPSAAYQSNGSGKTPNVRSPDFYFPSEHAIRSIQHRLRNELSKPVHSFLTVKLPPPPTL